MRTRLATILLIALALPLLPSPVSAGPSIQARQVIGGLDAPVAFTFGPGRTVWYVEKNTGEVRVHDLDTGADSLFVDVPEVSGEGERGMLGIALHPRYPGRPFVYVYATRSAAGTLRNQILRYEDVGGAGRNRTTIFSSPASSSPYHNGGRIAFGPDGMLYAMVGDGHDASNSQDISRNDRGKIIRIAPNGRIPGSNPFGNRIWAYGLRNSFGFAFDPRTERLWETDNGPSCNDELNLIRRGGNYGWGPSATCQGSSPGNTNRDGPSPLRPKYFYEIPIGITGIAFCDGCRLGRRSEGAAFFGSVNDGRVARMILNDRRVGVRSVRTVYDHPGSTLSFEVGTGGRIYFSDLGGIYRLVRG